MASFGERALGCALGVSLCVGLVACSEDDDKKPAGTAGTAGTGGSSAGAGGSGTAGTGAVGGIAGTGGAGATGGTAATGGTGATGGTATGGTAGANACDGKDMLGCDILKLTAAVKAGGGNSTLDGFDLDESSLQLTTDLADGAPAITSAKLIVHYCGCEVYYPRCDVGPYSPSNSRMEFPVSIGGSQLTSDLSSLAGTTGLLIDHLEYELQTECGETIHAVISNASEYDTATSTCSVNFGKFMFCAAPAAAGDGVDPDLSAGSTRTPASCGSNPSVAGATEAAPVSVNCDEIAPGISFDDVNNKLVVNAGSGLPELTASSVTLSQCAGDASSCAVGVQNLVTLDLFENGDNLETSLPSAADAATGRIHAAIIRLETSCNATYLVSISNPESSASFSLHHCYGFAP